MSEKLANSTRELIQGLLRRVNLPTLGIFAFSLCSTWSLYHLFRGNALHPTPLYWLPSVLIELVTAWLVYQVVDLARKLTVSNTSKQDKRFYTVVLVLCAALVIPTLLTSVWANAREFGGNLALGIIMPVCAIACAVGMALPQATARYEQARANERQERARERRQAQVRRKQAQTDRQSIAKLGSAGATLELYQANPDITQSQAAQMLGVSRQTVSNHLAKLRQMGLISRNGGVG